jgi:hypothetical protein
MKASNGRRLPFWPWQNRGQRFYHPTAAESYYGVKRKFKIFLTNFLQGLFGRRCFGAGSSPDPLPELTALGLQYETLLSQGTEITVDWQMVVRSRERESDAKSQTGAEVEVLRHGPSGAAWAGSAIGLFPLLFVLLAVTLPVAGRAKDKLSYGEGLIVNLPLPESEVVQVVEEVAQNGVIRGTKEYNKDEFVSGAKAATSSRVFPAWEEGGKVFYKVRTEAIDPRNFKDGGDVGTLAVRYVVQAQGDKNTVLRIDALFVEEFRHTVHQSNGSVESSEYKDIQEHIEAIEVMKKQNAEAEKERQDQLVKKQNFAMRTEAPAASELQSASPLPATMESEADTGLQAGAQSPGQTPPGQTLPGQTLEEHVKDLRKQVERLVKAPGAPLKSAPFHTASTLQSLATGTEVLILISTPYWYGVETHEGQHGWILRDQLEQP